jgi:dTDP-4-dehydrorhamnose reductase
MNKSILVLGSAGMAGHVIYKVLKEELKDFRIFDVARDSRFVNPSKCMDIKDFKTLEDYIEELKPDFIINCIGLLNKSAENFPDDAILINSYLPHFLESKTKNSSTKVIHISTDCVFSGSKGMYKEDDFRDATGYYAQTKALGELNNNKDLTIRTSIIGPELKSDGIGLFNWLMAQKGKVLGYKNAIWSGITTLELAKKIVQIINNDQISGIIHLTNNIPISKYEILLLLKKIFNRDEIEIVPDEYYVVNKSFLNTRDDFECVIPDYFVMFTEMKDWIDKKMILSI